MSRQRSTKSASATARRPTDNQKSLRLEGDELALRPDWRMAPELSEYLSQPTIRWRTDPVSQCVIVKESESAAVLKERFGATDETQAIRELVARDHGVKVIGCDPMDGMIVYSFSDDVLYRVDAMSLRVAPLPQAYLALEFGGLGRAARNGAPTEFDSIEEAIELFRREARKAQRRFLRKHSASRSNRSK